MTELPIQISRLPVHPPAASPSKPVNPTASGTGSVGFKLTLLTPRKPPLHCCLVFRNFYVAWLRIVQVNTDGSSTELATAYPLMQHVHCEDDAQTWQVVKLDQLPVSWNPHVSRKGKHIHPQGWARRVRRGSRKKRASDGAGVLPRTASRNCWNGEHRAQR
ncbi:Nicolin 1 [Phytophthora cinnamomi]|uniref:Nicolin 1 n=1 Tax=Phytophthora cinnamomi TaxID=4785 RepID=UPI0035595B0B|nr:Nicolin 1 [Phytophthora cinnamomi]